MCMCRVPLFVPQGMFVCGIFLQEYWSGLPFPPPGDLPDPGIKFESLASPALADRFFTTVLPGKLSLTVNTTED